LTTSVCAIIASGTFKGMSEDPVISWRREYKVKTQKPIYDPVAAKRKKERIENKRSSNFYQLMLGDRRPSSNSNSSNSQSGDNTPSKDRMFELVGIDQGDGSGSDSTNTSTSDAYNKNLDKLGKRLFSKEKDSSQQNSYSSSSVDSGGLKIITEVCGTTVRGHVGTESIVDNGSPWFIYDDDSEVEEGGKRYKTITLTKPGIPYDGIETSHYLSFYARDCAQESEVIPNVVGSEDRMKYYTNGGRKKQYTARIDKEWTRDGRLTLHQKRSSYNDSWKTVCDNSTNQFGRVKYPKCSQ